MKLKRVFDQTKLVRNNVGKVVEVLSGAVIGVIVQRSGGSVKHFSPRFVTGGQREGWLTITKDNLVVSNKDGEDLKFKIIRYPGHYCDHCEGEIPSGGSFVTNPRDSEKSVTAAYAHVLIEHEGLKAVDSRNPAGIRKEEFYTCVRTETGKSVSDLVEIEKSVRVVKAKERKVRANG